MRSPAAMVAALPGQVYAGEDVEDPQVRIHELDSFNNHGIAGDQFYVC